MKSTGIDQAVREYGRRHLHGDGRALPEFESEYGRSLKVIVSRVARSQKPRSRFEQVILVHLRRLSKAGSDCLVDSILVHRICEAMLVSSARMRLSRA